MTLFVLFAFFLLFGTSEDTSTSVVCTANPGTPERCAPEMIDDQYQLPRGGVVIRSFAPFGPDGALEEVEIWADGTIEIRELGAGAINLATPPASEHRLTRTQIQELIAGLHTCGFFYLPQIGEHGDIPHQAAATSVLGVRLDDGVWLVGDDVLTDDEQTTLGECQQQLRTAVGP